MEGKNKKGSNKWPLVGNGHISNFLERSIAGGKVAGAYIFLGPEGLGKATTAEFFAKNLVCSQRKPGVFTFPCGQCSPCRQFGSGQGVHLDYSLIKREEEKKNISISQVREFIRGLEMSSFSGSYKVGVVKDAQYLSLEAANALLKTLEEPKRDTVIILIATDLENIPSTIRSRSQVVNFQPVKSDIIYGYLVNDLNVSRSQAKNISRLCLGRPALALKFLEDSEFYNDRLKKAEAFLDIFASDMNGRKDKVAELLEDADKGQAMALISLSIINTWRAVARDLLLAASGNVELVQHEPLRSKIEKRMSVIKRDGLMNMDKRLTAGEEQINANVNPRVVLENLVYNI